MLFAMKLWRSVTRSRLPQNDLTEDEFILGEGRGRRVEIPLKLQPVTRYFFRALAPAVLCVSAFFFEPADLTVFPLRPSL